VLRGESEGGGRERLQGGGEGSKKKYIGKKLERI